MDNCSQRRARNGRAASLLVLELVLEVLDGALLVEVVAG
jgi:hypothetical protein